jgi:hypothetical protein
MINSNNQKPGCCAICGYFLTASESYAGHRCLNPGHWQAAGLLAPSDFYRMAQIAAKLNAELNHRFDHQNGSNLRAS